MGQTELLKNYRPNVGIVLFNQEAKVWFGQRVPDEKGDEYDVIGDPNRWRWQFPQGGVDNGEDIASAAYRELQEETGVTSARLLLVTPGWLAYDFPKEYKKKKWRGQRQKWAVMLFEGPDTEIDLTADDHQEFDEWRWGELEDAPTLIVPFKRHTYEELAASLTPLRDYLRRR